MTICDKIQTIGNTLQDNLNNRGVNCTFGSGTSESTILDMVEMVNDTNFKGSSDVNLKISANRPYLLAGETTDVVVKLEDGLCEPLANKNVIVGQSVFRDGGTINDYTNWTSTNSSTSLTRLNDYSELKRTENASSFAWIYKSLSVTDGITIEFDLKQATLPSSNKTYLTFRANGGNVKLGIYRGYGNLADGQWHHYKFDVNGLTVTPTIDGVQKDNLTLNGDFNYVQLDASEEAVHHFKNFVIYNNTNGVTDEKGEFALYNVSVTDDTYFAATYGTINTTCLVEYCRFVDYAVKNNHNHNYFNQQGTSKVTITEADEYKEFKTISTTAGNVYIGSTTSSTGFDVGNTWTIIYDKLYINGYNVAFQCYNGNTTVGINSTTLLSHNSDFQELKFVCDGSTIKAYVDGVYKYQTSYTSTGHGYLRINVNNNNGTSQVTFKAKNIRIK